MIKFHCSSLGYIMPAEKSRTDFTETCIKHLVEVFVSEKYGRNTDISNKFLTKGLMVEEDSITLYSRLRKDLFLKNKEQLFNEFITGTPDIYEGENIQNATKIIDVKSSWDIFTFFRAKQKLNKNYFWQLQGYMALTGAQTSTLAYCLVNTPETLINDEKRKLMWKSGQIDSQDEDFEAACREIERLSIYDDIPIRERIAEIEIKRDEGCIDRIYSRVAECREWVKQNLLTE